MSSKVRWGVLGAARIAINKVIPGMQKCTRAEVVAIASRDASKAQQAAQQLGLARSYGSYEELLNDPGLDAIYNPLPNHLHIPWSVKAVKAGKHVLCEKPISLAAPEVDELIAARDKARVKAGEAFMTRTHPQWLRTKQLVDTGEIGELRSTVCTFSYFNVDPNNVRNILNIGGGGVMDIGCYPITMSRWLFGREPARVSALIDRDPQTGIDRLSSVILDFAPGQAIFTCATQLVPFQRMQVLGTKARVEVEVPVNAPPDRPARIFIDNGTEVGGRNARMEEFPVCDQYGIQGDAFSAAIQDNTEVPVTLEDARANMAVIDAVFRAGKSGNWERV